MWLLLDVVLRLMLPPLALLLVPVLVLPAQLLRRRRIRSLMWLRIRLLPKLLVTVLPFNLTMAFPWPVVQLLPCRALPPRLQIPLLREVHVVHNVLIPEQLQHKSSLNATLPAQIRSQRRFPPLAQWSVFLLVAYIVLTPRLLMALTDLLRGFIHKRVRQGVLSCYAPVARGVVWMTINEEKLDHHVALPQGWFKLQTLEAPHRRQLQAHGLALPTF